MLNSNTSGTWHSEKLGTNNLWKYSTTVPGVYRDSAVESTRLSTIYYKSIFHNFSPNKNYIFKTTVKNFAPGVAGQHLNFRSPFETTTGFFFTHSHNSSTFPGITGGNTYAEFSTAPVSSNEHTLIYMSRPSSNTNTNLRHYFSSSLFGSSTGAAITSIDVEETDWFFQGYSWATSSVAGDTQKYIGWRYTRNGENVVLKYQYNVEFYFSFTNPFTGITTTTQGRRNPAPFRIGYKNVSSGFLITSEKQTYVYTVNNYSAKYINLKKFNLSFDFNKDPDATSEAYVKVYCLPSLPSSSVGVSPLRFTRPTVGLQSEVPTSVESSNPESAFTGVTFEQSLKRGQFLGTIKEDGIYNFYDVKGSCYLVFVSNYAGSANWSFEITNIIIRGGYSPIDNNEKFALTTTNTFNDTSNLTLIGEDPSSEFYIENTTKKSLHESGNLTFGLTGGTGSIIGFYSNLYGEVTNIAQLSTKIGNGFFQAGVWENGVWNNGWRDDTEVYDFIDVKYAIGFNNKASKWRVQISGPTQSVSNFEVGDKIAISNIVAIDINDKRKLFKNYFTIVGKNDTNIIVETQTNFPFRRIEKDSENHKILVTKNVWLNGVFLNGYFQGVWNDGLFKGYPKITEMYDSHWIDGKFDGGHFKSNQIQKNFLDTYFYEGNVGLTFGSVKHELKIGDVIEIDKDDKTVNPQYDTKTEVIEVIDNYLVITSLPWGENTSSETGKITSQSTGLIQRFEFNDGNVATRNSKQSKVLSEIWNFNSWIDVIYDQNSTTNIGSNKQYYNQSTNNLLDLFGKYKLGIGDYSPLNLYGFVTNDVLSSESKFRDIDSNIKRNYSLGTKYEIYQDFLKDLSVFNTAFGTTTSLGGLENFYNLGWTFSYSGARLPYQRETVVLGETYLDRFEFFDNYYHIIQVLPGSNAEQDIYLSAGGPYQNVAKIGFIGTASNLFSEFTIGEDIYIQQYIYAGPAGSGPFAPTVATYSGKAKALKVLELTPAQTSALGYGSFTSSVVVTDKDFIQNTPAEGGIIYYKKSAVPAFTFSRTIDGTFQIEHNDYSLQNFVLNNNNINIDKNRYSIIEFDYLNGPDNYVYFESTDTYFDFHFIDLFNFTTFAEFQGGDLIYGPTHAFPSQPTSDNSGTTTVWASGIDYKQTKSTRKVEYFYNRTSLDLGFLSLAYYNIFGYTQSYSFEIDNIKFYEVDMIPFFQYTTEEYINKSIQVPYQAIAPKIDYSDEDFLFLDHIQIGLDSVILNESNQTIQMNAQPMDLIFQQS